MSFDYEKVIPAAIPMKRQKPPRDKFNDMNPMYTAGIKLEAQKTSQLFKQKIEADRKRLGLS